MSSKTVQKNKSYKENVYDLPIRHIIIRLLYVYGFSLHDENRHRVEFRGPAQIGQSH